MNKKIIIILVLFLFAKNALAYNFYYDMKIGDTAPAILELQKILNTDKDTLVSKNGKGSIGQETDYFGKKTFEAVKRFQKKNILLSTQQIYPTGHVDLATRQVLNKYKNKRPSNKSIKPKIKKYKP